MSVDKSLVSICLPVFNGSKHLPNAIDSVLAQTYSNFELIVSDDCSRDGSLQIIEDYAKRDSRIKVLRSECNLGLFANYNRCINAACGDFIKPFAQDDLLHPEALARAIEVFAEHPPIALLSLNKRVIDDKGREVPAHAKGVAQFQTTTPVEGTEVLKRCLRSVCNEIGEPTAVMFRADCKGTGFDETFRHLGDLEYWLRILMHGSYVFIEAPLCSFRIHESSATKANKKLLLDSVELLRFGKLYGPALASMEGAKENFYEKSMNAIFSESEIVVKEYAPLIDSQGIRLSDEAKKLIAAVPSEEYFELALRVLAKVHNDKWRNRNAQANGQLSAALFEQNERIMQDRSERIHKLEREFSNYLNSRSWRMSKHLRELNKRLNAEEYNEGPCAANKDDFKNQEVYETYLENQIWRLKNSLSWRITMPVRFIETNFDKRTNKSTKQSASIQAQ